MSEPARRFPWAPGVSTGLGSLPGSDVVEAVSFVLDTVPEFAYLPELPARGLGADMIGRTASLLVELPMEWQPHGWTVTGAAGQDLRRARDFLHRDLDAITEHGAGLDVLKVQVTGPVTLAANAELPNLHKVLSDHGAFRDLSESLAEGVRLHLAELASRLPGTALVLQLDEPSLPAALSGSVPTPSGYGTVRSISRSVAGPALQRVLAGASPGSRTVHCCAADVPFDLLVSSGADAVAIDFALLNKANLDSVGEIVDAGTSLWLGVVPSSDAELSFAAARERVFGLWRRLGFDDALLAGTVVPTPACGLAGASPGYARRATKLLRDVGRSLLDGAEPSRS
ncbi:methionine synthase [Jatrophihabitans telluris]|uniref:Methionine synthase n=1 Tax=Jatrophihabitans telluris TaxID=2038343 RepID=A0ABY4R4M3_9ACTN|nr:methionine synthase [Jatrophihabitans telluris]UQX89925.1 methionine synthase [Jatrophihabitans telluris]